MSEKDEREAAKEGRSDESADPSLEPFTVYELAQSTTLMLYLDRSKFCLDPPYQRFSDVWTLAKKQLLIDSILNGFDIPKLYFIEGPGDEECRGYKYAVVDGKQRLGAIWDFMDDKFPLDNDFRYREDPGIKAGGLKYSELAKRYPRLKAKFEGHRLSVVVVKTNDMEILEEMFSRLNEGEPLSAAEKRNAMGGPIPPLARELSKHPFFTLKLPFQNRRGRHWEIATKFLFFEDRNGIADTKRDYLDKFVSRWKEWERGSPEKARAGAQKLYEASRAVLDELSRVFEEGDSLLRATGMVILYYLLAREVKKARGAKFSRATLERFEDERRANREIAREDVARAEWELLEFDRLSQSLNDASALKFRLGVLSKRVLGRSVDAQIVDPVRSGESESGRK